MTRQDERRMSGVRNFCIIAHIDHGKSTLADRLIEKSGVLTSREMQEQVLDNMELERERGITIKAQAVRLIHKAPDGEEYTLNLIDTPGHVDFTYEVSRSLAACEGAVLVVDASQGVEAQTLANVYLALENDLEVVPVINKIDLIAANPEAAKREIEELIGLDAEGAPEISAKNDINIDSVFDMIIKKIPPPKGDPDAPLRALIFDSVYDSYKGVIVFIRVLDGRVRKGTRALFIATEKEFDIVEAGFFGPGKFIACDELSAGDVGYITASIKNVRDTRIGDTVTEAGNPTSVPFPGYKKINSMVYCGIFPVDGSEYNDLRDALDKLQLNDAALQFEPETSTALGYGFRCGFLGLLHLEIIEERLEREYNLELITTAPSVIYKVYMTDGNVIDLSNPSDLPDVTRIEYIEKTRAIIKYEMPLNEIIYDFFDTLKSRSRGYASLDYELTGYQESDLVKLDILVHHEPVDALSFIVFKGTAHERGRILAEKLKKEIPRHQFEIPIQACIGSKVVARETIGALRKDVLAKCYGGDVTRKKKLLEKQKEGKKKMRQIGVVEVPQQAFMNVLKLSES